MTPRDLHEHDGYDDWDRDHGREWAGIGVAAEDPDLPDPLDDLHPWDVGPCEADR